MITEEGDKPGDKAIVNCPPVLPVPDGGGGYAELGRDILLVQAELETAPAQMVAECGWFLSELGK